MIPDLVALIRSKLFVRRLLEIPFLKVSFDTLADLVLVRDLAVVPLILCTRE